MKFRLSAAAVALACLIIGAALGVFIASPPDGAAVPSTNRSKPDAMTGHNHGPPAKKPNDGAADEAETKKATVWTCSMHPAIKLPEPGLCPICNMDLIPLETGGAGALGVEMTDAAKTLARIATTVVKREAVHVRLRMVGKVTYDETRVARLTAWFGGRIERLFVDFTGTVVKKGDHMLALYSPELMVAQQELIQAGQDRKRASGVLRAAADSTYKASRDKLRLWGLQDWQIRSVERRGRPLETVTIFAPMGGVVTHKAALEGAWVKTGTPVYTIADLTHVWVELDAYESDIAWLRYGQRVMVDVDAFPGQPFEGAIAFVNPVMNERTRTIKVRVHIDNPDLRLKPGMFVRAVAKVPVTGGGTTGGGDMAGKFVCPMHPEVVSTKNARCRICGMKLVPAETHWLVGPAIAGQKVEMPLVIPHTAPLITGKRVVVFVEKEGAKQPTYLVREIVLGPRAGDQYVVVDGLMQGEKVVSHGAFRLDSAMQIVGDPSIMNPGDATDAEKAQADNEAKARPDVTVPLDAAQLAALKKAIAVMLDLSGALAADDNTKAAQVAEHLHHLLMPVGKALGDKEKELIAAATEVAAADTVIDKRRAAYTVINKLVVPIVAQHKAALGVPYDQVYCPMAADGDGASWLQKPGETANPYFGEQMLRCGGRKDGFKGDGAHSDKSGDK